MATVEGYYSHPHVQAQLYPDYESAIADDASYDGLGYVSGLGASFEDNLKRVFAAIPGASGAYNDLVLLIQSKAKQGAEAAIPRIKGEVEATVKPYVIAAMLLGFGGFLFGISTFLQNRKRGA